MIVEPQAHQLLTPYGGGYKVFHYVSCPNL